VRLSIAFKEMGTTVGQLGILDPLGAARVSVSMAQELQDMGFGLLISTDLKLLAETKLEMRADKIAPFYDASVNAVDEERVFWMRLSSPEGKTVGMQAFRYDYVDTNLADWGPSYIIGLYMRRQELLMPSHAAPPRNSIANRIKGRLVYHGELWLDSKLKNRKVMDNFPRLGLILAYMKWNPDAVWALVSHQMAAHGHMGRIGFPVLERGFLRWQWPTDGIDPVEYLGIAERSALEQMIDEMLTTTSKYQLEPTRTEL
jgi:hypothetical protein